MRSLPRLVVALWMLFSLFPLSAAAGMPMTVQDAAGRPVTLRRIPQRVVSIVPSVTEILCRIGAGDALVGVTYHDVYPPQAAAKTVIGGFFAPSVERIAALQPDMIFLVAMHASVTDTFDGDKQPHLVQLSLNTFDDLYRSIRLLGQMFDKGPAAEDLIQVIKADLAHTADKVAAIPADQRQRVMRLMGRDRVMTPGDDSFQNEMIRRAGGIAPTLGQTGSIVSVSLAQWQAFNPQVLYGCGGEREVALKMLDRPGWRDVDAVKNNRIVYFPCDLTCRLSSRTGYFVSCLAAKIYAEQFASLKPVRNDGRIASRPVALALDYVGGADIVQSVVNDYVHKTLLIHLNAPMAVASTLDGYREKIRHVGNSYSPPQVWGLYHHLGLETARNQLMGSIGRDAVDTSMLFTGADMDHLSIQRQTYRAMSVYALVTAGVRSNAVRMAEDVGAWYEPGTINMIVMTNMQLTSRAMNRAIISATEAKTAALQDLDIRSSYTPMTNPATGTGTDNIIVVQGAGERIDNAGGHSKMGELIAKAVYIGVQEAIFKQNGIFRQRHLMRRLKERRISLFGLIGDGACGMAGSRLTGELERLLMNPAVIGFVEAAMAISDAYERGLVTDLSGFAAWCGQMTVQIAGGPVKDKQDFAYARPLPPVLKMTFDALLNGAHGRLQAVETAN